MKTIGHIHSGLMQFLISVLLANKSHCREMEQIYKNICLNTRNIYIYSLTKRTQKLLSFHKD